MNKTSEEIMDHVSKIMTESAKSYIENPPITIDSFIAIKKQMDAWNTITSQIIMSMCNYNILMGISNKIRYICC